MKLKKKIFIMPIFIILIFSSSISVFAVPENSNREEKKTEIANLESKLEEIMDNISELEKELVTVGEDIEQNEKDLEKAQEDYDKQYEAMKDRIQYLYENNTSQKKIESIMNSKSLAQLNSEITYINHIEKYDQDKLEEFIKTKEKIEKLQKDLKNEKDELEKKNEEFEKEKDALNEEIKDKKLELSEIIARQSGYTGANTFIADSNSSTAEKILAAAYSQLGVPYVWVGTTPGVGLDCSGLTQYCHRIAGISIPRLAEDQGRTGMLVSSPEPGDVVCYPGHVGIYVGDGQMIAAPKPGDRVKKQAVYGNPWYVRFW